MKVVRVNRLKDNGTSNKTLAFFDIETSEGVVIKGLKLINGSHGIFAAAPNQKGKDGKYYDTITVPKELMDAIQKEAAAELEKNIN